MSDSFSRFLIKRMNKTPTEMTLKWETNGWWCIHIALIVVVNSIVRHTNIFKKAPNTQNNKQKANKTQKAHRETKQQQKKGRITRFVFGFVVTYIVCFFFSLSTSRLWFYFVVVVGCFFSVVRWCFFFHLSRMYSSSNVAASRYLNVLTIARHASNEQMNVK